VKQRHRNLMHTSFNHKVIARVGAKIKKRSPEAELSGY